MNKPKKYAKGGMHKMPDGKMMKNSAMSKSKKYAMGGPVGGGRNAPPSRPTTLPPAPSQSSTRYPAPVSNGKIGRAAPIQVDRTGPRRGMSKGGMANKPKGKGMAIMIAIGKPKGRGK